MRVFILAPEITEYHTALAHLPSWIRKISLEVDNIILFTLNYDNKTELTQNIVIKCPKRKNKLIYFFLINYYILMGVIRSDVVFTLMYPILAIWASRYSKLFKTPLVMWYAHGALTKKTLEAVKASDLVVTSSADGFRSESRKRRIIGQAIDTDKFIPIYKKRKKPKIMYLGRISKSKNLETLIEAANVLINKENFDYIEFEIVGAITSDSEIGYYNKIKKMIKEYDLNKYFKFRGTVPFFVVEKCYQNCDIFVNPSYTGSLDKTVLEAMSCEKVILTSNQAYYNIFNEKMKKKYFFNQGNYIELSQKIKDNIIHPDKDLQAELRRVVINDHNLDLWVKNLLSVFKEALRESGNI